MDSSISFAQLTVGNNTCLSYTGALVQPLSSSSETSSLVPLLLNQLLSDWLHLINKRLLMIEEPKLFRRHAVSHSKKVLGSNPAVSWGLSVQYVLCGFSPGVPASSAVLRLPFLAELV